MDVSEVIQQALIEYDKTSSVIKYLTEKSVIDYQRAKSDNQRSKLIFRNKEDEKEILLETEVELVGIFYDKYNFWSFSWAIPGLLASEFYLVKKVLIYALGLGIDLLDIRNLLISARSIITDENQLDLILAITGAVTKHHHVFRFTQGTVEDKFHIFSDFLLLNEEGIKELSKKLISK
jgi:hypothetical protein